ncbi:hypothetical protein ACIQF6_33650 [Kitasatospora sp. NPDC092948]|uniref:hypothetical protein n=1 Tax=Kitasatospora sp. NPDC092948 TaxID=3364088 RepID=UPI003826CF73
MLVAASLGAALLAASTTASADTLRRPDHAPAAAQTRAAQAKGCVNADRFPFVVTNDTQAPAIVFDEPNCTGDVIGVVPPGQTQTFEFGQSAYFTD